MNGTDALELLVQQKLVVKESERLEAIQKDAESNRIYTNDQYADNMADMAELSLKKLQGRVKRQQKDEHKKIVKKYQSVVQGKGKSRLHMDLEEEQRMIQLEKEELQRIAKKRPQILLPFNDLIEKVMIPVDQNRLYEEIYLANKDQDVSKKISDIVRDAGKRYDKLRIPHFKQDYGQRLVKINQVDREIWNNPMLEKLMKSLGDTKQEEIPSETTDNNSELSDCANSNS